MCNNITLRNCYSKYIIRGIFLREGRLKVDNENMYLIENFPHEFEN